MQPSKIFSNRSNLKIAKPLWKMHSNIVFIDRPRKNKAPIWWAGTEEKGRSHTTAVSKNPDRAAKHTALPPAKVPLEQRRKSRVAGASEPAPRGA